MNIVTRARRFAMKAHEGQYRRYSKEQYWMHCHRVAEEVLDRVYDRESKRDQDILVAAAYLHDTVEDTDVTSADILEEFGEEIHVLVMELTNKFTKEDYPTSNRRLRKKLEAKRLGGISRHARIIKLCDIHDNLREIVKEDPDFSVTYLREKAGVLEAMGFGK